MEHKSYYAIIPANVRYDDTLPANAKLLYGEITALCNEKGYCWAGNDYFAQLYKVSKTSISKWVAALINRDYITSEIIYKEGTKQILNRYIRIVTYPIEEKLNTPIEEKLKENNTSSNNTSNKRKKETSYDEIINSKIANEEIRELVYEFIKMRQMKKKPLTDRALTIQINKLYKLSSDIEIQKQIIEKSIVKNWDEFYQLNNDYKEVIKNGSDKKSNGSEYAGLC